METKIYLVRHTQTIGNVEKRLTGRQDYDLTKDGQAFVDALAKKFSDIKIDIAYSSTSKRAIKTIEPITKQKGLQIIEDERLCEMYFGIYDGWKWEDVNRINPKIHQLHIKTNEIMQIPNQESTKEVANRMYECIKQIAQDNIGKSILIASHGVAIEAFLRKITGEPFVQKQEEYSQKNTSINEILFNEKEGKFKVIKINNLQHLKEIEGRKR